MGTCYDKNPLDNPDFHNSWIKVSPLHMAMLSPDIYNTDINAHLIAESRSTIEIRALELAKFFIETYKVDVNTGLIPYLAAAAKKEDPSNLVKPPWTML